MQLLIIRHGQSEADLIGVHEGRADYPLTVLGEKQAKAMAQYVEEKFSPDIILASPLKRAAKTAEYLQGAVGCPLEFHDELMEFNNGVLAGLKREEAAIRYPLPPGGRPSHVPIEGGESDLQLRHRAEFMLAHIMHEYADYKRVAIVSHGGFISNFLKVLFKQHGDEFVVATGDTGIHFVEIRESKKIVHFLNRQEHLRDVEGESK